MSINTELDLSVGLHFLGVGGSGGVWGLEGGGDNFQATFVDFRFMMFSKVLIKKLAHILIQVHKIFNRRVSFKMLWSMYLVIIEKKLYHSCDLVSFGIALSKNLP